MKLYIIFNMYTHKEEKHQNLYDRNQTKLNNVILFNGFLGVMFDNQVSKHCGFS